MSILTEFYTYEVMDGAIIHSVSSEATGQPAEHAISPLEPDFSWKANEASTQHTLVIDLGETRECDGFSFMHNENESPGPPVSLYTTVTADYSSDGVNWTAITLVFNSDGSNDPSDLTDGQRIKIRFFFNSGAASHRGRYWRFTIKGSAAPNFYAPSDSRFNMLWLFRSHLLDKGASYPVDDVPTFPADDNRPTRSHGNPLPVRAKLLATQIIA